MARKGLPASIIKKYGVTKKAWSVFRGRKRASRPRRSSNPGKGVRKMARRRWRGRRRGRGGFTLPLAPIAGLACGLMKPFEEGMKGNVNGVIAHLAMNYTGYDPNAGDWQIGRLTGGLVPLVVGLLVHKFIGGPPLNLNRTLGRAKVPFIRI